MCLSSSLLFFSPPHVNPLSLFTFHRTYFPHLSLYPAPYLHLYTLFPPFIFDLLPLSIFVFPLVDFSLSSSILLFSLPYVNPLSLYLPFYLYLHLYTHVPPFIFLPFPLSIFVPSLVHYSRPHSVPLVPTIPLSSSLFSLPHGNPLSFFTFHPISLSHLSLNLTPQLTFTFFFRLAHELSLPLTSICSTVHFFNFYCRRYHTLLLISPSSG